MDALYGLIVFAGLFFDVVIYSIWLKRRTCLEHRLGRHLGRHAHPGRTRARLSADVDWIGITARARHPLLDSHPHPDLQHEISRRTTPTRGVPTFPSTYGRRRHARHDHDLVRASCAGRHRFWAGIRHRLELRAYLRLRGSPVGGPAHAGVRHHPRPVRARQLRPVPITPRVYMLGRHDHPCHAGVPVVREIELRP
ncbi:MAG: hypothetical protein MZV64_60020 [Ignavibacteriales bacterium]|nr:hypothetical protein [Ignavibacteriales bacterium]